MSTTTRYIIGSIIVLVSTILLFYLIANILYEMIITAEVQSFIRMWDIETPSYFKGAISSGILYTLLFITIGILQAFYRLIKKIIPPEIDNKYVWIISSIIIAYIIYTVIFSFKLEGSRLDQRIFSLERMQYIIYASFFGLMLNNLNEKLGKIILTIFFYALLSAILISASDLLITNWEDFSLNILFEYFLKGSVILTSLSLTVKYIKPIELDYIG